MKTITFDFSTNLGGIEKIYAIAPEAIASIDRNYTDNTTTLHLTSTDSIIDIYCSMDTLQFTEKQEQTSAGSSYSIEITGITPKQNPIHQEALARLESEYWTILFKDNNGNYRLAGNEEELLTFQRVGTTGKKMSERNQIEFVFIGTLSNSALFIDNKNI